MADPRTSDGHASFLPSRLLTRARTVLVVERLWPLIVSLLSLAGLFAILSWLGLWLILPPVARAAGVLLFAAAAAWLVWRATRSGWPDRFPDRRTG